MFEMYAPNGKIVKVDQAQVQILKEAGYSFEKPVVKVEEKKVQVK